MLALALALALALILTLEGAVSRFQPSCLGLAVLRVNRTPLAQSLLGGRIGTWLAHVTTCTGIRHHYVSLPANTNRTHFHDSICLSPAGTDSENVRVVPSSIAIEDPTLTTEIFIFPFIRALVRTHRTPDPISKLHPTYFVPITLIYFLPIYVRCEESMSST